MTVPALSVQYPGNTAILHEFSAENAAEKITVYAGPGKEYTKAVSLAPNSQKKTTVYFEENDCVFTYM